MVGGKRDGVALVIHVTEREARLTQFTIFEAGRAADAFHLAAQFVSDDRDEFRQAVRSSDL